MSRVSAIWHTRERAGMNGFLSISGCFFVIGETPKIVDVKAEANEARGTDMNDIDGETDLALDLAEGRINGMMLTELVDALLKRGALKREDIAGALLRTEFRASFKDEMDAEDDSIILPHAETAKRTTEAWATRFALSPEIYTLRKADQDWRSGNQQGQHPLSPAAVIELYSETEEKAS